MKRNNVNKTTISNCSIELALLISFLILLPGQMIAQQKRGADERFKEARELAFSGDRSAAIDSCKLLLVDHPNYTDVRVFMARVMIWEKNYDESIKNLKLALKKKRRHIQAYNTIIDAYRWSGDLENALHYNDIALGYHDEYEDFYIKKAKILLQLDRPDISAVMIWRLLKLYPGSVEGNIMKQSISGVAIFNKVKLQYRINMFPDTAPWHLSYLEYSRKLKFGTIIARLVYANRFNKNGFQFETDGYIKFRKGTYTYLNLGVSDASIFPKLRFGIEPYQMLPLKFEISLGLRYLKFKSTDVWIYTGSLGKYIGNFWISYRFYYTPKTERTSFSSSLYVRKYFSDADSYLTLRLGVGIVSYTALEDEEFSGLSSKGATVEYQFNIAPLTFLQGEFIYSNFEYFKGKFRDLYGLKLGIERRF